MSASTVTIRPATRQDIPAMTGLLAALFSIEKDFVADPGRQAQGLSLLLSDACQNRVLVAESQERPHGRVIGMVVGQLTVSTAQGTPSVLLEDLVVEATARGRGIGRMLVEALADWAHKSGATRIQLLADRNNAPAFEFYGRLGFGPTSMVCLRRMP